MISRRPVGSKHVFCDYASRSIEEHFRDSSVLAADWLRFTDGISDEDIDAILENTKQRGRSEYNLWFITKNVDPYIEALFPPENNTTYSIV